MCRNQTLWIGDAVVLALMTTIGFLVHGTQGQIGRLALTAVLAALAWYLAAGPLGLLRFPQARQGRWWLRLVWAEGLATPLALSLRGVLLMQPIAPMFVVAAFTFNTLGLFLWRLLVAWRCPASR